MGVGSDYSWSNGKSEDGSDSAVGSSAVAGGLEQSVTEKPNSAMREIMEGYSHTRIEASSSIQTMFGERRLSDLRAWLRSASSFMLPIWTRSVTAMISSPGSIISTIPACLNSRNTGFRTSADGTSKSRRRIPSSSLGGPSSEVSTTSDAGSQQGFGVIEPSTLTQALSGPSKWSSTESRLPRGWRQSMAGSPVTPGEMKHREELIPDGGEACIEAGLSGVRPTLWW